MTKLTFRNPNVVSVDHRQERVAGGTAVLHYDAAWIPAYSPFT
jgi:hypothetical protein